VVRSCSYFRSSFSVVFAEGEIFDPSQICNQNLSDTDSIFWQRFAKRGMFANLLHSIPNIKLPMECCYPFDFRVEVRFVFFVR